MGLGLANTQITQKAWYKIERRAQSCLEGNPVADLNKYELRHLAEHLEASGRIDDLHSLLALETSERRNAWYEAKESLSQIEGYLDDVRLAWRLAELASPEIRHGEPIVNWGDQIGLQCRYALIISSFNSLAENTPAGLSTELQRRIWPWAQGLVYARHLPEPNRRSKALVELVNSLPEQQREGVLWEALSATREISDDWERSQALIWLAPHLRGSQLYDALLVAQGINKYSSKAEALAGLVPHLPEPLRREALAAAQSIPNSGERATALAGLSPYLPEPLLREALTIAQEITDEWDRARALVKLAPHLPEPLLQEALAIARMLPTMAMKYYFPRIHALVGLAPHLLTRSGINILPEALVETRNLRNSGAQAEALIGLAPHLPETLLREALTAAQKIRSRSRSTALVGLAPYLTESLLDETLTSIRKIKNKEDRAELLVGLAPYLSKPLLREALRAVESEYVYAETTPSWIQWEAEQAYAFVRKAALPALVNRFAQLGHFQDALKIVESIPDEIAQADTLVGIAPYLPEPMLKEVLATIQKKMPEKKWVDALVGLAPRLAESILRELLAAVREIQDEGIRSKAFAGLAPHLSEPFRGQALQEALAAVREIKYASARSKALSGLASHLSEPLRAQALQEALAAAREIQHPVDWTMALDRIAPLLPEPLLQNALEMTRVIEDKSALAEPLAELAPYLPEAILREALVEARDIQDQEAKVKALTGLAFHLPEPLREETLQEALSAAQDIQSDLKRSEALAALAPQLPEPLLQKALALAMELREFSEFFMSGIYPRATALIGIIPHLAKLGHPQEALMLVKRIPTHHGQDGVLINLAPHLPEPLLREALAVARKLPISGYSYWDSPRTRALKGLAPYLSEPLWKEALTFALTIGRNYKEEKALEEMMTVARRVKDYEIPAKESAIPLPITQNPLHRETLAEAQKVQDQTSQTIRVLSNNNRRHLLSKISKLVPTIAELGGENAIIEVFRAMRDVSRWWP